MSIQNHSSADIATDATLPAGLVPAARIVDSVTSEIRAEEVDTAESAEPAEAIDYRHVSLASAGTTRVRYSRIEPLMPRRLTVDDDLS